MRDTLSQLVLDDSQPLKLRAEAAEVITDWGTVTDKMELLPFTNWSLPPSEQDKQANETLHHIKNLKGSALQSNWPGTLSTQEMFACLEPTYDSGHYLS